MSVNSYCNRIFIIPLFFLCLSPISEEAKDFLSFSHLHSAWRKVGKSALKSLTKIYTADVA